MTARNGAWLALAALVVATIVFVAWPEGGTRTERDRARDLWSELRCPDCEALSVADSSTGTARAIRRDVRARVARGESDAAIRQAYVDRFGETILLEPEGSGLGVIVWGLPVAALLIGGAGLALALRRWHRTPRLHATDADENLVEASRTES